MIHLRQIALDAGERDGFPFAVPALASLEIELDNPVTLLVGENGTGKSTFLEALACAVGSIGVGTHSPARDPTLRTVRPLADALRVVWDRKTHKGFFMRAEDFFGFVNRVKEEKLQFEREAARVRAENPDMAAADLTRMLGPQLGSSRALEDRYGEDMDAASHGEQFLALFQSRLVPGGLYLLDEPEVALSPTSQMAFLSILMGASRDAECQFLIATHSPILMALPNAAILSFDFTPIQWIEYEDVEHVRLTRDFLAAPERFLRHL